MPGIVGFVGDPLPLGSREYLRSMAKALETEERFRSDLYEEPEFGFGRVSLGILNPEPQPVWDRDRMTAMILEGEIFNREVLRKQLRDHGAQAPMATDAELALQLYEHYGQEFGRHINGGFVAAVWDRRRRTLVVTNDRLGSYPIYIAEFAGMFLFASGVRALLADPRLPRRVDPAAIAAFLTFDHLLGQRTLLSGVTLLPQASVLTLGEGRLRVQSYWRPEFPRNYPVFRNGAYTEEAIHLLRQSVARQRPDGLSAAILLSGGMDSRALLGAMAEVGYPEDLTAFTWGIPGSDEVRFAREASRQVGFQHHFVELKPGWLLEHAERGVRLTDGMANLVNLHAMSILDEGSQHAKVVYKGFLGDAMFGFGLRPRYWAEYDEARKFDVHLEAYRDYDVLTFDLPVHAQLFTDAFARAVGSGVIDDYRAAMAASGVSDLSDQRIYIDLTQRVPRMTIHGVQVLRDRMAVRLPFSDNDLLDFSLRIPSGLRLGRQVIVQAFIEAYPKLAQIPFTPSGLPMVSCARDLAIRTRQLAQWHLGRAGLGRLAGPRSRPAKDYATWFRTVLRGQVEGLLLDPVSLDRGYFQPAYVRQLVQEHMAGANHAVRLGSLLTLELWHRQFVN